MKKNIVNNLIIRTSLLRRKGVGFIYACDPIKERREVPHVVMIRWDHGDTTRGEANYDAHSACSITNPEAGIVMLSELGDYSLTTAEEVISGNIIDASVPPSREPRISGFRSVASIAGKAYAVGYGGMIYRLDRSDLWARIDDGVPEQVNIDSIDGFDDSELYAVGLEGEVWHRARKRWKKCDVPTNAHLSSIKCAPDGVVYIAGLGGVMIRGREETWETIDQQATSDDVWDLEWFKGRLYASTAENVYVIEGNDMKAVDFGNDRPQTCYQLSSVDQEMWSNGEHDVMSFDGKTWSRIAQSNVHG